MIPANKLSRFQILVHVGSLTPLMWLGWDAISGGLTVNPIQELTRRTGKYALAFLLLCLACSPVNSLLGFRSAIKVRRALGLYAFFYALLHFSIFLVLDYGLDFALIEEAVFEKRFALVGFSAFIILTMLAGTSTRGWKKRLGKKWKWLHRSVYLAGSLVIVHYMWAVKADIRIPLLYGFVLLILLSLRIRRIRSLVLDNMRPLLRRVFNRDRNVLDFLSLENFFGRWGRKIAIFIKPLRH